MRQFAVWCVLPLLRCISHSVEAGSISLMDVYFLCYLAWNTPAHGSLVVTLVLGYATMLVQLPFSASNLRTLLLLYHGVGLLWSLVFSQFTDIRRKDFLMMFVYHLVAVGLISCSYINNMVRVGSLVICLHDAADLWSEVAKLANYAKYQQFCDLTFILFSAIFIFTCLGIYPIWILNTMFKSWKLIGPYPSWWLFIGLLVLLQILHVIWSYFILHVAYKVLAQGKVSKDYHSDVESSSDEEDPTSNNRKKIHSTSSNGTNWINGHISSGQ